MPEGVASTRDVMAFIAGEISLNTSVNLMDQYRPYARTKQYEEIDRPITEEEFEEAFDIAL